MQILTFCALLWLTSQAIASHALNLKKLGKFTRDSLERAEAAQIKHQYQKMLLAKKNQELKLNAAQEQAKRQFSSKHSFEPQARMKIRQGDFNSSMKALDTQRESHISR